MAASTLEHRARLDITEKDLPRLQPILQKRLWDRFLPGSGPDKIAKVIDDRDDSRFHT